MMSAAKTLYKKKKIGMQAHTGVLEKIANLQMPQIANRNRDH